MQRALSEPDLDRVLRAVSRSIYLTLRAAPRAVRRQLSLAYLFCRAADTIADTRVLSPAERLETLRLYRRQFEGGRPEGGEVDAIARRASGAAPLPEERELMARLPAVFGVYLRLDAADQECIRRLVPTLTRGMEFDLERFPPEESGEVAALETDEELDRYCYHVAGCVGEFWTDLTVLRLPALESWDRNAQRKRGVRFGKGLQMTNVLRDVDRDLAIGRCYLPRARLEPLGIDAAALRAARDRSAVRPAVRDLLARALEHYEEGLLYTLEIPARAWRLRLACSWPLLIGLGTLRLLAEAEDPCAPGRVLKISRRELRGILARSLGGGLSRRLLDRTYRKLERPVRAALCGAAPAGRVPSAGGVEGPLSFNAREG